MQIRKSYVFSNSKGKLLNSHTSLCFESNLNLFFLVKIFTKKTIKHFRYGRTLSEPRKTIAQGLLINVKTYFWPKN